MHHQLIEKPAGERQNPYPNQIIPSLKKQEIPFEHSLISETELLEKSNFEEFPSATENKAVVLCSPEKNCGKKRLDYNGSKNCALFFSVFDTEYNCKYI